MRLSHILKDSNYKLIQFKEELIHDLEQSIIEVPGKKKTTYKVVCLVREKEINLTPEEIVRQLYLRVLLQEMGYPTGRVQVEFAVSFGVEKKRADIVIMDKDRPESPYIIIELKKPKLRDGKDQLRSYCNATGAPMGVWTNGDQISFYHRKDPNYFEDIPRIPTANERLSDVLTERWTIEDLVKYDKLVNERKSLKGLILEMEDEVLANAGVDVFEELFKLIFTKLYDEMEGGRNKKRHLVFKNYGETETELKAKIFELFDKARQKWEGVFSIDSKLQLTPSHLSICVASLEGVKLFNSNLEVIDEAFEYLINKTSKGEKGQYFTPRYVIDMCVKMLNPKEDEKMIDTAAGSCGFPVHTIFYVWRQILREENIAQSHLFSLEQKPARCEDYVRNQVFAIDFDEKAVRVGRTLNLIAGDGQTNVLHLNTLDYERWYERTTDEDEWLDVYGEGWRRLRKLRADEENRGFKFDVLMANPPFAGDIKETRMLAKYALGKKPTGKYQTSVGRDILFIERNLDFLKPGGRLAVVLPQGRFNNSSDRPIREFIAERCRILAVVGLHGNVFKPHTGTKTSVLLLQKWTDEDGVCPRRADYPIFFATMREPSKDNSGDKLYVVQSDGMPLLDEHGHLVVAHDLFNHEGLTQDGVAEAFVEFAKKEKLSFFELGPFDEARYRALLEGLRVAIIKFSDIDIETRIDSEYYTHTKTKKINIITKNKFFSNLGEHLIYISSGHTPYRHNLSTGEISFITVECIKELSIDLEKCKKITTDHYNEEFKLNRVKKGVVLCTIKRRICQAFPFLYDNHAPMAINQDVSILEPKNHLNPSYLAVYLNCKIGQYFADRQKTEQINPYISVSNLSKLPIWIPHFDFQLKVEETIKIAYSKLQKSKTTYTAAENLLLEALDLKDFQPSQENINIKSFKDSFLSSGRLDAEYYQPKYEEVEERIKSFNHNTLDLICNLCDSNFFPVPEQNYFYIELSDIGTSGEVVSCTYEKGKNLPTRARRIVEQGDIIISSIEGSLTKCALITEKYHNALCSTGFFIIKSKLMKPESLLVIFKSKIMQELMKKACSGTILTSMNKDEFMKLVIPIISKNIQTQIAEKIQTSFHLRQQSEHLLQLAKHTVERAIETDEHTALSELEQQLTHP